MLKVVSNSSPLICLAKIGHLDLLKYFFDEIIVPEAVYTRAPRAMQRVCIRSCSFSHLERVPRMIEYFMAAS